MHEKSQSDSAEECFPEKKRRLNNSVATKPNSGRGELDWKLTHMATDVGDAHEASLTQLSCSRSTTDWNGFWCEM